MVLLELKHLCPHLLLSRNLSCIFRTSFQWKACDTPIPSSSPLKGKTGKPSDGKISTPPILCCGHSHILWDHKANRKRGNVKTDKHSTSLPMRTASALTTAQHTALSPSWPVVLSVKEWFCLNHWYKTLKQNETRQIRKKKSMFFPKITLQVDQIQKCRALVLKWNCF